MPLLGVAVAVIRGGRVLLARRVDLGVWSLPGGAGLPEARDLVWAAGYRHVATFERGRRTDRPLRPPSAAGAPPLALGEAREVHRSTEPPGHRRHDSPAP